MSNVVCNNIVNTNDNLQEECPKLAYFQIGNWIASGDRQKSYLTTRDLTFWTGVHKVIACSFLVFDLFVNIFVYFKNKNIELHNQVVRENKIKLDAASEREKYLNIAMVGLFFIANYMFYNYKDRFLDVIRPYAPSFVVNVLEGWHSMIYHYLNPPIPRG